jgi:hypothetical protein
VQEQHRLAMRADLGLPVAEDARAGVALCSLAAAMSATS